MMTEEGEAEAGVHTASVSTEPVQQESLPCISDSDERICSNIASGSSVTIDQMVRDFIIAKTLGMNGSDRGGDSIKTEHGRKGNHKSNKDKKKKKKKKHKSHRKDSSSKHRRHHHQQHVSSESSSSDEDRQECTEERSRETDYCVNDSKSNGGPLKSVKTEGECQKTSQQSYKSSETKETLMSIGLCIKCSCGRQRSIVSVEEKTKTDGVQYGEVQCDCLSLAKADDRLVSKNETVSSRCNDAVSAELSTAKSYRECCDKSDCSATRSTSKHCMSETSQVKARVSSDSQHAREATCCSHRENTSIQKHSVETRKLPKQDDVLGSSSKSSQFTDNTRTSDCAKKQHSSRVHRSSRDATGHVKSDNSRKQGSSLEKNSDRHSALTEDYKSDDVVFVKKTSARDMFKSSSSRETVSNREKSNREQKLSHGSSRGVAVGDSRKEGSKRRHDSNSSGEGVLLIKSKSKTDRRQTKDSPVILLSDDDIDVLSDEMVEKLHKRLTTSIKKSKELQAERELSLVANLKTSEPATGCGTELEESKCCDTADTQTDAQIIDTSHGESASMAEQSTVKSTAAGLFGKKTLKFGLKISESSAAWISKGVKSSQTTGKKVQSCCISNPRPGSALIAVCSKFPCLCKPYGHVHCIANVCISPKFTAWHVERNTIKWFIV